HGNPGFLRHCCQPLVFLHFPADCLANIRQFFSFKPLLDFIKYHWNPLPNEKTNTEIDEISELTLYYILFYTSAGKTANKTGDKMGDAIQSFLYFSNLCIKIS